MSSSTACIARDVSPATTRSTILGSHLLGWETQPALQNLKTFEVGAALQVCCSVICSTGSWRNVKMPKDELDDDFEDF